MTPGDHRKVMAYYDQQMAELDRHIATLDKAALFLVGAWIGIILIIVYVVNGG